MDAATDARVDQGSAVDLRRVLLVYANGEREPWPVMPVGLGFVARALEARGHRVRVVDLVFEDDWPAAVRRAVRDHDPQLIGVGIRNIDNCDWHDHRGYLDRIREQVVEPTREAVLSPIVVGGAAVNIAPRRVLDFLGADAAVHGDGEEAFCELVEEYGSGREPAGVVGVLVRHRGGERGSGDARRVEPLTSARQPELFRWVDPRPYIRAGTPYPVQTKRGCALDCSFCVYGAIEGSRYRLHDPEAVADEIEGGYHHGFRSFEFTDSMFNIPIEHAVAVCRAVAARGLRIGLNTSGVHPGAFTPELLRAMEAAGFEEFSFAPDSASPAVLASLGKGFDSQEPLIRAAGLVKSTRLKVVWWFSFGLPGETAETVAETLAFVRHHVRPSDLALCTVGLRILPGTRLETIAIEEGSLEPDHDPLEAAYYEPTAISLEEILRSLEVASAGLPNLLLNSDTRAFPLIVRLGNLIKRVTRHRQPVWAPIPIVNRVRNLGRRAGIRH